MKNNNPGRTDGTVMLSKVYVVLPSFEPDEKLLSTIDNLINCGFSHIVLIDDGSDMKYDHFFSDAVLLHPDEIILLRHNQNRGKGAALKTGFRWIVNNRPDAAGVVTVDGDGQLLAEDTVRCSLNMLKSNRVTLGCRDFNDSNVPFRSRAGNKTTVFVFYAFCGIHLTDTQTGLRAIPARYLPAFSEVTGDRFEYETNMLLTMKDMHLDFDEVCISTVYIDNNSSTHFNTVKDSFRIYWVILTHRFSQKSIKTDN